MPPRLPAQEHREQNRSQGQGHVVPEKPNQNVIKIMIVMIRKLSISLVLYDDNGHDRRRRQHMPLLPLRSATTRQQLTVVANVVRPRSRTRGGGGGGGGGGSGTSGTSGTRGTRGSSGTSGSSGRSGSSGSSGSSGGSGGSGNIGGSRSRGRSRSRRRSSSGSSSSSSRSGSSSSSSSTSRGRVVAGVAVAIVVAVVAAAAAAVAVATAVADAVAVAVAVAAAAVAAAAAAVVVVLVVVAAAVAVKHTAHKWSDHKQENQTGNSKIINTINLATIEATISESLRLKTMTMMTNLRAQQLRTTHESSPLWLRIAGKCLPLREAEQGSSSRILEALDNRARHVKG